MPGKQLESWEELKYLGSGQTCLAVRLNFTIANLSGREEAVLEGLDSIPPAHTKPVSFSKSGQSKMQWPKPERTSPVAGCAGDDCRSELWLVI